MKCAVGLLACAILLGSCWSAQSSTPIDTTLCEIVKHPSDFLGKKVRVHVQHIGYGFGKEGLVDYPSNLELKSLTDEPCLVSFDISPDLWKDSPFALDRFPLRNGVIRRFPMDTSWGSSAIAIGTIHYIPKPTMKPDFVRNSEGKVVEANLWQNGLQRIWEKDRASIRIDIESFLTPGF